MSSIHYTAQKVAFTVTGKVGEEEKQEQEQVSNLMRDLNQNSEIIRTHNYVLTKPLPNTLKNDTTWKNVLKKANEINKKEKKSNSKISETLNNGTIQSVTLAIRLVLNSEKTTSEEKKAAFEIYGKHVKPKLAEQEHINNISELMSELNLNKESINKYKVVLICPHNLINDSTWNDILKKAKKINEDKIQSPQVSKTLNDGTVQTVTLAIRLVLNSEQTTHKEKEEALDLFNKIRPELQKGKIENLPLPFPPIEMVGTSTAHEKEVTQTKTETESKTKTKYHDYYQERNIRYPLNYIDISKYDNRIKNIVDNVKKDLTSTSKKELEDGIKLTLLELEYIDPEGKLSKKYLDSLGKISVNKSIIAAYYSKICQYSEIVYIQPEFKDNVYKDIGEIIDYINESPILSKTKDTSYLELVGRILDYNKDRIPSEIYLRGVGGINEILYQGDGVSLPNINYLWKNVLEGFSGVGSRIRETLPSNVFNPYSHDPHFYNTSPTRVNASILNVSDTLKIYAESIYPRELRGSISHGGEAFKEYYSREIEDAITKPKRYIYDPREIAGSGAGYRTEHTSNKGTISESKSIEHFGRGTLQMIGDKSTSTLKLLKNHTDKIPKTVLLNDEKYVLHKSSDGKISFSSDGFPLYRKEVSEVETVEAKKDEVETVETKNLLDLINMGATNEDNSRIIIDGFIGKEDYFDNSSRLEAEVGAEKRDYIDTWSSQFNAEFIPLGFYNVETGAFNVYHDANASVEDTFFNAQAIGEIAKGYANRELFVVKGHLRKGEEEDERAIYSKMFYKDGNRVYEVRVADNTSLKFITSCIAEAHEKGHAIGAITLRADPDTTEEKFRKKLGEKGMLGKGLVSFAIPKNLNVKAILLYGGVTAPLIPTKTGELDEKGEESERKWAEDRLIDGAISLKITDKSALTGFINIHNPETGKVSGMGGFRFDYFTDGINSEVVLSGGQHNILKEDKEKETSSNLSGTDFKIMTVTKFKVESGIVKINVGYVRGVERYEDYTSTSDSQKTLVDGFNRVYLGGGYEHHFSDGSIVGVEGVATIPFYDDSYEGKRTTAKVMTYLLNARKQGFKVSLSRYGAIDNMLNDFADFTNNISNDRYTSATANKKFNEFMKKYEDVLNHLWDGSAQIYLDDTLALGAHFIWPEQSNIPQKANLSFLSQFDKSFITGFLNVNDTTTYNYFFPNQYVHISPSHSVRTGIGGGLIDKFRLDFYAVLRQSYVDKYYLGNIDLTSFHNLVKKTEIKNSWALGTRLFIGSPKRTIFGVEYSHAFSKEYDDLNFIGLFVLSNLEKGSIGAYASTSFTKDEIKTFFAMVAITGNIYKRGNIILEGAGLFLRNPSGTSRSFSVEASYEQLLPQGMRLKIGGYYNQGRFLSGEDISELQKGARYTTNPNLPWSLDVGGFFSLSF